MIRITTLAGQAVAVFGLARSGLTAATALRNGGADVACWDDQEAGRAAAREVGLPVVDLTSADWNRFGALVLSPGVPLTHPTPHWTVTKAQAAGVPIIGDVELFFRERRKIAPASPVIAITGTNGKSTTTALIAHLLTAQGHDVALGGNIGKGVLSLPPPDADRIHVLELSSFQIDLTPTLEPTVGVLLNVTPDHLDRHGTFEHYAAIKARLPVGAEAACVAIDDPTTRAIAEDIDATKLFAFTTGKGASIIPRLYAIGDTLFAHEKEGAFAASHELASLGGIRSLRGQHNVQNALGALTALRALQARLDARAKRLARPVWHRTGLASALATFPGLPHRLEEVGQRGRVIFVNDSKATNSESTAKALAAFDAPIYWILGGRPKEGGIATLASFFPRIAKAYLIGEATEPFAATLSGKVHFETSWTLDRAVQDAAADAQRATAPEAIVLLSPACASYDQFTSFEHRGDVFRTIVRNLDGVITDAGGA
jgi:UDP-N-acetylmuramoylalanine--D-glutamate ligase